MVIVTKPISVEVSKPNVFQAIAAKQSDCNSRFLKVTFVNEGEKINVPSSSKVTINATRNDGQSESFFGTVNSDGTATVPIHSWMLELEGYVSCDVSIIGSDSKLTCTTFDLLIEKAAHNSDDVSQDPQYDVLTDLIQRVEALDVDSLESKINKNDKRITNLEQGLIPSPFVTNSSMSIEKGVPSNALPFAEIGKIGGMTFEEGNTLISASVTSVESIGEDGTVDTFPIPEAVQALEGYGWGIDESVYNYIDFEKKQFVKRLGRVVFDGNEEWIYEPIYHCMIVKIKDQGRYRGSILKSHYIVCTFADNTAKSLQYGSSSSPIEEEGYSSVEEWKAYLKEQYENGTPVTTYYELATPIITDISHLLSDDNYICVEGSFVIIFNNEHGNAVPSEITFQVKGDT